MKKKTEIEKAKESNCRVIVLANNKGGVGKTTTAISLANAWTVSGKNVLLVDLDSQANTSHFFLAEDPQDTIFEAMVDGKDVKPIPIRKLEKGLLDLMPSSLKMSWLDSALCTMYNREHILSQTLQKYKEDYDIILIDCPPALGMIVYNAFLFATDIIVPLLPDAFSVQGLDMTVSFYNMVVSNMPRGPRFLGILLTQADRTTVCSAVENAIRSNYGDLVFKTAIRKTVAVRKAQSLKEDICAAKKRSAAAVDYGRLADEILKRMEVNKNQTE